jgi:hypothetical protein
MKNCAKYHENNNIKEDEMSGHVGRKREIRKAYKILVGKSEMKRPLGRRKSRGEDNIKWISRK